MTPTAGNDFLSIGINRRFVQAVEYLSTKADIPTTRKVICARIGIKEAVYTKIKMGQRGLPARYINQAAIVLMDMGIRPDWFHNNRGEMLQDKLIRQEDSLIIDLLRTELREKEKYISSLEKRIKLLETQLSGKADK